MSERYGTILPQFSQVIRQPSAIDISQPSPIDSPESMYRGQGKALNLASWFHVKHNERVIQRVSRETFDKTAFHMKHRAHLEMTVCGAGG